MLPIEKIRGKNLLNQTIRNEYNLVTCALAYSHSKFLILLDHAKEEINKDHFIIEGQNLLNHPGPLSEEVKKKLYEIGLLD